MQNHYAAEGSRQAEPGGARTHDPLMSCEIQNRTSAFRSFAPALVHPGIAARLQQDEQLRQRALDERQAAARDRARRAPLLSAADAPAAIGAGGVGAEVYVEGFGCGWGRWGAAAVAGR